MKSIKTSFIIVSVVNYTQMIDTIARNVVISMNVLHNYKTLNPKTTTTGLYYVATQICVPLAQTQTHKCMPRYFQFVIIMLLPYIGYTWIRCLMYTMSLLHLCTRVFLLDSHSFLMSCNSKWIR